MKTKLSLAAAFFIFCAPAVAQVIDITDHPNKAFFVGYDRVYKRFDDGSVCSARYAQLRSGHEQIGLNVLCDGLGITKERIYDDLMTAMKYADEHSSAKSFEEYFRMTRYTHFSDEPRDFCIFRNSVVYIFTDFRSPNNPDWKFISTSRGRPGSGSPYYGLWKADQDGGVTARIGANRLQPETIKINMKDASDCGTLKPYEPGLLLPSD